MGVKGQQGGGDQKDLFDQALQASLRLGATGEGGTGSGAHAEPQALAAFEQQRALTQHLMEEVAGSANLNQAYKRVRANKGAAGVDAMSIADLLPGSGRTAKSLSPRCWTAATNQKPCAGWKSPSPAVGIANSGSRPWWTVLFSRRFCKSLNRFSTRPSRRRVSASARARAPIKRSPRPRPTSPTGARLSWTWTWRSSSTGSTTTF